MEIPPPPPPKTTVVTNNKTHTGALRRDASNLGSPRSPGSAADDITRMIVHQKRETSQLHKLLAVASKQLEDATQRADAAERTAVQSTEEYRLASNAQSAAQQEAARAVEEARLFRFRVDEARVEALKAKEEIVRVERERLEAEREAERAKGDVWRLREQRVVRAAREEGRRIGLREGIRRGRAMAYRERDRGEDGTRRRQRVNRRRREDFQERYERGVTDDQQEDTEYEYADDHDDDPDRPSDRPQEDPEYEDRDGPGTPDGLHRRNWSQLDDIDVDDQVRNPAYPTNTGVNNDPRHAALNDLGMRPADPGPNPGASLPPAQELTVESVEESGDPMPTSPRRALRSLSGSGSGGNGGSPFSFSTLFGLFRGNSVKSKKGSANTKQRRGLDNTATLGPVPIVGEVPPEELTQIQIEGSVAGAPVSSDQRRMDANVHVGPTPPGDGRYVGLQSNPIPGIGSPNPNRAGSEADQFEGGMSEMERVMASGTRSEGHADGRARSDPRRAGSLSPNRARSQGEGMTEMERIMASGSRSEGHANGRASGDANESSNGISAGNTRIQDERAASQTQSNSTSPASMDKPTRMQMPPMPRRLGPPRPRKLTVPAPLSNQRPPAGWNQSTAGLAGLPSMNGNEAGRNMLKKR